MTWTAQRRLVNLLSEQAHDQKREAKRVRNALHEWMSSYLGSREALVWLFAIGALSAAGRSSAADSSSARRLLIAAINTSLLAWQLVNRQFVLNKV